MVCFYFLYFIHFIFVSFRLKYRNACIKSFIRTYRLVQTMFFSFSNFKTLLTSTCEVCTVMNVCMRYFFSSLVSFRRTNNVAIFWSIWHNFSVENTISFDRWSIYSNANCMQKKTHWLGKQHAYTYAYTWWFIFMFVPIFLFVFVFRYPQSFVYFIWAHFTLDTICANLYYSHIFLVHFSYTREPTNKKRFSHFLIVVFWKLNKNQMSSIFRMPLDDLFCSPIYKTQHAVDIWEWNTQLIIS